MVSTWGRARIKIVKEIHQNQLESLSKLHLQRSKKVANILFINYPEPIWNGVDVDLGSDQEVKKIHKN